MKRIVTILAIMILPGLLGGCAFDVIRVEQIPVTLSASTVCENDFILAQELKLTPGGGYDRTLKRGTNWECVGAIPQGAVFRTRDQVLTVEASNVYEAYIVVSSNKIVGFYLPVERTFSPLVDAQAFVAEQLGLQQTN